MLKTLMFIMTILSVLKGIISNPVTVDQALEENESVVDVKNLVNTKGVITPFFYEHHNGYHVETDCFAYQFE